MSSRRISSRRTLQSPSVRIVSKNLEAEASLINSRQRQGKHISLPLHAEPHSQVLLDYLQNEGICGYQIAVFDRWVDEGIARNIETQPFELEGTSGKWVCFEEIRCPLPQYVRTSTGKSVRLTPKFALETGVTYARPIIVTLTLRQGGPNGELLDRIPNVEIGNIPIMLMSSGCYLRGRNAAEIAALGQDPGDVWGYFIVNGSERTIQSEEHVALSRVNTYTRSAKNKQYMCSRITVMTPKGVTRVMELVYTKKPNDAKNPSPIVMIKLELKKRDKKLVTNANKNVNVVRVFRQMGIQSIAEIESLLRLFLNPETAAVALTKMNMSYVDAEINPSFADALAENLELGDVEDKEGIVRDAWLEAYAEMFPHLNQPLFNHEPTTEEIKLRIHSDKVLMLAFMTARLLDLAAHGRKDDDLDNWAIKRLHLAATQMSVLLRGAHKEMCIKVKKELSAYGNNVTLKQVHNLLTSNENNIITKSFQESFTRKEWGTKLFSNTMKANVAQALRRESVLDAYAHVSTVNTPVDRTDKNMKLRAVHGSQQCIIDPVATSEGSNCGLLKNISLTIRISFERKDEFLIRNIIEGDWLISFTDYPTPEAVSGATLVLVNAKILGWTRAGKELRAHLVGLRRQHLLEEDIAIALKLHDKELVCETTPYRVSRPLFIIGEDGILEMDRQQAWGRPFSDLVSMACVEYLSSFEIQYADIYMKSAAKYRRIPDRIVKLEAQIEALQARLRTESTKENYDLLLVLDDKHKRLQRHYTHCEIDPQVMCGVLSASIPFLGHNMAPRNTYQSNMFKQALGIYHSNHKNRFDGKTKVLSYPTVPLVDTEIGNLVLRNRPQGTTAMVAFLMKDGYTQEDAFIVNRTASQTGLLRYTKYFVHKVVIKPQTNVYEEFARPPKEYIIGKEELYRHIQPNGFPMIGAHLRTNDVVVGMIQQIGGVSKANPSCLKIGEEAIVDAIKVFTVAATGETYAFVKLRITRQQTTGSKMAPRNSQKGTESQEIPRHEMPQDELTGISPDIIVNPQCIPSRQTASYLLELMASLYAVQEGVIVNASPYHRPLIDRWRQVLKALNKDNYDAAAQEILLETMKETGFEDLGYRTLISPKTGMRMKAMIFTGPVYFQALKHHVEDKIQSRGVGAHQYLTHQPLRGKANGGGIRFGEMERDALLAHGSSAFLLERLCLSSDKYDTVVCGSCSYIARNNVVQKNELNKGFVCDFCKRDTKFLAVTIPYVLKFISDMFKPIGINLRVKAVSLEQYRNSVLHPEMKMESELDELATELNDAFIETKEADTEEVQGDNLRDADDEE